MSGVGKLERESIRLPTFKFTYTNQLFERNTSMLVSHRTVSGWLGEKDFTLHVKWCFFFYVALFLLFIFLSLALSLPFPLIQTYDRLGASFGYSMLMPA